jgi:hypothetical protein
LNYPKGCSQKQGRENYSAVTSRQSIDRGREFSLSLISPFHLGHAAISIGGEVRHKRVGVQGKKLIMYSRSERFNLCTIGGVIA